MILVLLAILSFAISFANLSRCGLFLSWHPCVWNPLLRAFAENSWKEPRVPLSETHTLSSDSTCFFFNGPYFGGIIIVANRGNTLDWHDWHCIWWPVATVVVGDRWPVGLWLVVAGWFLQSALRKIRSKNPLINFSLNKFLGGCAIAASRGFRGSFAKLLQIFGLYRNVWIILLHGSRYIWGSYYMLLSKSKHILTILTRILILKISFASFRGSKSSHKFWQIFCKRGFSFRGANLQYFNRPSNHTNHHVRTEGFWRLLGPGICRWSSDAWLVFSDATWCNRFHHQKLMPWSKHLCSSWCVSCQRPPARAQFLSNRLTCGFTLRHMQVHSIPKFWSCQTHVHMGNFGVSQTGPPVLECFSTMESMRIKPSIHFPNLSNANIIIRLSCMAAVIWNTFTSTRTRPEGWSGRTLRVWYFLVFECLVSDGSKVPFRRAEICKHGFSIDAPIFRNCYNNSKYAP